jgi:two-component system, OmpR family, phosphate regulon sensor histidine kinase PhoR
MGKKRIISLIVVMSVALALLILVQVNIIGNAVRIKEEQFGQLVTRSLMRVSSELEQQEYNKMILTEQFAATQYGFQSGFSPNQAQSNLITHTQINFSLSINAANSGSSVIITDRDTTVALSKGEGFVRERVFKSFGQLNDTERRSFLKSWEERDLFLRRWYNHFLLANRPIEQRIDKPLLEALLRTEFANNSITGEYGYVIKSFNRGEGKIILESVNYKPNKNREYKTPLFTHDVGSPKPNYLMVSFKPKFGQFLRDTSYMVLPSIILVIVIIAIFTYTILIILQQKKISMIKNDFINNMTHELKTPISTISLASQMLRDSSINNTPISIERISGVIYDESRRLSMQVEKVLQQAIFNEGRLKLKFKQMDLNEVVSTATQNFEIRIQNANGQLIVNKQATDAIISGDQVHITNVLFNLLDNAVKYSCENPVIEVSTENKKNGVSLTVKDNGIGIAKEHQKQIFERFFRVPTGNLHDVKGFGLGLHYVNKIVEAHGGTIKVESILNKGTSFVIHFPKNNINDGSES